MIGSGEPYEPDDFRGLIDSHGDLAVVDWRDAADRLIDEKASIQLDTIENFRV